MNLNHLHCIDLDVPQQQGFRQFISCWLYQTADCTFVVDPGPVSTIPLLLEELQKHAVDKLDYILLTHIHIDHAGGTGALLKRYPEAQVICHPQGIKHMIAPEKLWQGSQKVLGKLADLYGQIVPVPENRIAYQDRLGAVGIEVHQTPGHAQHHCCFRCDELLFGGEVAGVHYPLASGIYMRPATPSRFILDVAVDSLQRMLDLQPSYLVIAHYGLVSPACDYLNIGLKQLKLWVAGVTELSRRNQAFTETDFSDWLLRHDENFRLIEKLPADIQARERHFLGNSLRGMKEYVDSLQAV